MAPHHSRILSGLGRLSSLGVMASSVAATAAVTAIAAVAAPQPTCAAESYPEAVAFSQKAAHAVLNQEGRETCLRGKLTKALLQLSESCASAGQNNALCAFATKALVVTPMSVSFMEDTSRKLLELGGKEGR